MSVLKNLTGLLLLSLLSTSCLKLDGQLDVKQAMSAKKKSGFLNLKTKEIKIEPDLYNAELKVNGDKSFTLKLDGRNKILIPIKSEKSLNVPGSGVFAITHDDISQPFDLKGDIRTTVTHSGGVNTVEECSWTVTEKHCQKICEKPDACDIVCKDVQVTLKGSHDVSYHYRTTHRDLSVDFLKIGKGEVLATFAGSNTEVDRITDFEGVCR